MNSKLPHAIFGTFVSWMLAGVVNLFERAGHIVNEHGSGIALCFAIFASIGTIWAAIETALWRRKQRKNL